VVEVALEQLGGNKERVGRELSVSRSTLFKKMKEWGLTNEQDKE
jgi:two-component system, NtrC family, response regulator HydG